MAYLYMMVGKRENCVGNALPWKTVFILQRWANRVSRY